MYPTEDDMMNHYETNTISKSNGYNTDFMKLVFADKNVNSTTKNLKYKIETPDSIPTVVYEKLQFGQDLFDKSFTGLQLCVDQSLIKMKKNDPKFNLEVRII